MKYYEGEIKTQATEIHEIYDKVIFKTDDPNPEKIFRLSIQYWVNSSLEVEDGFENSDDDYIGTDGFGASYFAEWFDEISKKAFEELQEVGSDHFEITEKDLETQSVINDYKEKKDE
tara:strand:- start:627 stop:977 length:351 start_codon:yes stop_codon:yes gene_type:complete